MAESVTNASEGLVLLHLQKIVAAEKKKDEAVNALRTARKAAKTDGVDLSVLDMVRSLGKLDEHELTHGYNQLVTYSQFLSVPVYNQLSLFDPPNPSEDDIIDIASGKGLRAGKLGQDQGSSPYEPGSAAGQAWLEGWHQGQKIILEAGIRPLDETPAEAPKRGRKKGSESGETAH